MVIETYEERLKEEVERAEKIRADEDNDVGKPVKEKPKDEEALSVIERAEKAKAELDKGLKERKEVLEREEKLFNKQETLRLLGGRSEAGDVSMITEEQRKARETAEFFKGTPIETAVMKHGQKKA